MVTPIDKNSELLKTFETKEPFWHAGFWFIYLLFPFLKSIGRGLPYHFYSELNDLFFGLIVFYVSYLFFFPSNRKLLNGILLLFLFCVIGYFNLQFHNFLFKGTHQESFLSYYAIGYISTYSILALVAYLLYSIKDSYKRNKALEEAQRKKQQAELSLLKSQVNPHFLFNTLNTIYSSALKKEDKTAGMILKLSDNFRYVLHEGQKELVSLRQEITHLRDYINLQRARHSEKLKVDFILDIDDEEQFIAPLLLISFVENMFKYTSLLKGKHHIVKIKIGLKEKAFLFYCENPFSKKGADEMDLIWKESGVGIESTKKRLALLYPDRHQLQIVEENEYFKVTLKIQL